MAEPCENDCFGQRYPSFPYGPGAERLFSTVLPIILSLMVVVISWLAGRFIDKIEVSTPGSMTRTKSGTLGQSAKRSVNHDKSDGFHSTASRGMGRTTGKMLEGVQELDGISARDDEQNRLYHEEYGSQASQEDGERYDDLGDSPGAQGPSSQGPRSPSVYSHFSQSVFSQSAYGPSAYGPSQRRQGGPGSMYSQYGEGSSQGGGSQYPGPVPSHFGASQLSSDRTSYHASNGGSSSRGGSGGGVAAGVNPGAPGNGAGRGHTYGGRQIPAPYGGGGAGEGRGAAGTPRILPPPSYNPNAHSNRMVINASPGLGLGSVSSSSGGMVGSGGGGGAAATAAAAAAGAATAAVVAHDASGLNRGSPPPYSQAASTLPKEPRPSVDSRASLDPPHTQMSLDGQERRPDQAHAAAVAAAAAPAATDANATAGVAGAMGPSSGGGELDSERGSFDRRRAGLPGGSGAPKM
ncbi:unnamed protein product [Pylaiella littoralis]